MTGAGASPLGSAAAGPAQMRQGAARPGADGHPQTQAATPRPPARSGGSAAADAPAGPGERGAGDAARPPFSELLSPAAAEAPVVKAADTGAADREPDPAAPGQLLALLDGPWWGASPDPLPPLPPASAPTGNAGAAATPAPLPAPLAMPATGAPPTTSQAAPEGSTENTRITEGLPATGATALPAGAVRTTATPVRDAPAAVVTALAESLAAHAGEGDGVRGFAIESTPAMSAALQALPPAASRPQAAALPPLSMPADHAAGFDDGLGERIAWMVDQRVGHAEIRLNPEHLGPIDIRVELDGDIVRAGFHSAHTEVLEAIEATLPRLRDLLGQHGLQLGQPQHGPRQGDHDTAPGRDGSSGRRGETGSDAADDAPARPASIHPRGLVDMYA